MADGDHYRFYVVGAGGRAVLKRDPWARELEPGVALVDCDCIVRARGLLPVARRGLPAAAVPRAGRLPAPRGGVLGRVTRTGTTSADGPGGEAPGRPRPVEYLADLGVNAVQPLPLVEFHGELSLGYNGTDVFSPETDYCVTPADLAPYVALGERAPAARTGCAPGHRGAARSAR